MTYRVELYSRSRMKWVASASGVKTLIMAKSLVWAVGKRELLRVVNEQTGKEIWNNLSSFESDLRHQRDI